MKRLHIVIAALIAALALTAAMNFGAQKQSDVERQLKAAMNTELVDGNLKAAIEQYKKVAESGNRPLAAQALLHMAECYQKLGDSESRKIYERVVRDFPEQKEAVTVASAHLGGSSTVGMSSKRVWNADTYGSVSPDGRYISFIAPGDWRKYPMDNVAPLALGLHDLRSGVNREIERFTSNDEGEGSVISKDGKLIVYTAFSGKKARYQLRLTNIEGDPKPRLLFDNPDIDWVGAYDWSPDSRSVVVLLKRKDRTAQIGLVSIPDGSLRILKSVDWRGTGRIFFTPDGKYLGYDLPSTDTTREHDVFVLSADGSREVTAVAHPSLNFMMGWSPDGKWLLFASNRTGANSLWALPFADGKLQGSAELVRANIGPVESLGVTRSGSFYYGVWSNARPTSSIQVASLEPGTGRIITTTQIPKEPSASDTQPSWSPDGRLLAYVSTRGITGSTIEQGGQRSYVLVTRSSETNQIVHEFDLDLSAGNGRLKRWTQDGNALLVSGVDGKGRPGLFRVDAQTGQMSVVGFVELKPPAGWPDGDWKVSADAAALYRRGQPDCTSRCTEIAFYRREVATGADTELVRGYQLGYINLSPNDEYIATPVPDPAKNSRTFAVIPTKGGKPHELLRVPTGNPDGETGPNGKGRALAFAAWSPDSRFVFIREILNGKPVAVWRASLDGAAPEKLSWAADQLTGELAISPNGNRIAFIPPAPQSPRSLSEIWMLENFLPSARSK